MALHAQSTDVHQAAYVQTSDPGAVGAGKLWLDTSGGTGTWTIKSRNAADTGWESVIAGSISSGTITAALLLQSVISPTSLGASVNDYSPPSMSTASWLRLTSSLDVNITGLATGVAGRTIAIINIGAFNITLKNSSGSSSATNRFLFSADIVLTPNTGVFLIYDNTGGIQKWRGILLPSTAPISAQYVTLAADATLTSEAVLGSAVIMQGVFASKPAASISGLLYYATDTDTLYRDNGATWDTWTLDWGQVTGKPSTFAPTAHDHTTGDGSGVLTNDEHDGYSEYVEISTPSNPAANKLRVYAVDDSGVTKLATVDNSGTITILGSGGGGGGSSSGGSGLVLIEEHTVGAGGEASWTSAAIASGYKDLLVVVEGRSEAAAVSDELIMRFNGDSGANYDSELITNNNSSFYVRASGATSLPAGYLAGNTAPAGAAARNKIAITNYAGTTFQKGFISETGLVQGTGVGDLWTRNSSGNWRNTAAITTLTFLTGGGSDLAVGTIIRIYGLNGTAVSNPASLLPLDIITSYGSGDSFAGTSLDGGWTDLQSTGVTSKDASIEGFLILKNTGNTAGQDRGIKRAFVPAGDFSITTKILWTPLTTDFQWGGLFVGDTNPSDSAGGARLGLHLVTVSGAVQLKFYKMAAAVETVVGSPALTTFGFRDLSFPLWLRIKRVGATLTAGISFDGVQYQDYATTTTIAFTVNTCGVHIGEATATQDIRTTYDYIATA